MLKLFSFLVRNDYFYTQQFINYHEEDNRPQAKLDRDYENGMGVSMGRLREVCGAVSGMFMVAGLIYGYDDPNGQEEKKQHYERIQELAKKFQQENGSIICRELLGLSEKKSEPTPEQRTERYYKKRPCPEMVKMAAEIMEQYIKENPKDNLK